MICPGKIKHDSLVRRIQRAEQGRGLHANKNIVYEKGELDVISSGIVTPTTWYSPMTRIIEVKANHSASRQLKAYDQLMRFVDYRHKHGLSLPQAVYAGGLPNGNYTWITLFGGTNGRHHQ